MIMQRGIVLRCRQHIDLCHDVEHSSLFECCVCLKFDTKYQCTPRSRPNLKLCANVLLFLSFISICRVCSLELRRRDP